MKEFSVLFIGPVGQFGSSDAGYGNATVSIHTVLRKLTEEGIITYLETVDTTKKGMISIQRDHYDFAFFLNSPSSFNDPFVAQMLSDMLKRADRRAISLNWETNPLPSWWNWMWESDIFTDFIAQSEFVYDLVKDKTEKPVHRIPYYFDVNEFKQVDIADKMAREEKFTVLYIGQYTKRKGLEDAVVAFSRSLAKFPDTRLLLKYTDLSQLEIPIDTTIEKAVLMNIQSEKYKSSIFTIREELSFPKLNYLYQQSSVLLFPSRGEGFGFPVLEASCVGIPVIYTNWSAINETACLPGNLPVGFTLDSAVYMSQYGYEEDAIYAIPSIKELQDSLLWCYDDWKMDKKAYYENVQGNAKLIDDLYNFERVKGMWTTLLRGE